MSSKSIRGIQSEDVQQAADALIAEGLRPTIERVRQKIGRGSPNTVSPLLDLWFATLAARLGLGAMKDETSQPPEPVLKAAAALWEAALQPAREEAAQALTQACQALEAERANLAQRENDFERDKQGLTARQLAADEALQVARSQLSDSASRLEEASALLGRRERDIDTLREKLTTREAERDADLRRSEEQARSHAEERARLEARATANEHRLLEELDHERQETRRAKAALADQERRAAVAHAKLETENLALNARLQDVERDLKTGDQTLASARSRTGELENLLEAQKMAHATTLKQLDVLLARAPRKPLARPAIRRHL